MGDRVVVPKEEFPAVVAAAIPPDANSLLRPGQPPHLFVQSGRMKKKNELPEVRMSCKFSVDDPGETAYRRRCSYAFAPVIA